MEGGKITYTDGATQTHQISDEFYYTPAQGRYYLWTEGQEATQTTVEVYENKAFDFGFFEADALVKDENKISTDLRSQTTRRFWIPNSRRLQTTDCPPGRRVPFTACSIFVTTTRPSTWSRT